MNDEKIKEYYLAAKAAEEAAYPAMKALEALGRKSGSTDLYVAVKVWLAAHTAMKAWEEVLDMNKALNNTQHGNQPRKQLNKENNHEC